MTLTFLAIVIAACILCALYCEHQARKVREELRKEWNDAVKHHRPSAEIHRRYVRATAEELRRSA
jgi:hypothetical protein